jgi:hypothetical protein
VLAKARREAVDDVGGLEEAIGAAHDPCSACSSESGGPLSPEARTSTFAFRLVASAATARPWCATAFNSQPSVSAPPVSSRFALTNPFADLTVVLEPIGRLGRHVVDPPAETGFDFAGVAARWIHDGSETMPGPSGAQKGQIVAENPNVTIRVRPETDSVCA